MLYLQAMTKHEFPADRLLGHDAAQPSRGLSVWRTLPGLWLCGCLQARAGLEVLLWRIDVEQKT
jgi:hypothetical protein